MKNLIKNKIILLMIAIFAVSINAEYRIGVDYRIADNPLPVKKDGIVEVTESFWYCCNACYQFEPAINDWASKQNSDVKFTKMPVPWSRVHEQHAALFYTIESLKLDKNAHAAVFVTIHKEGNFLNSPEAIQTFLAKFGIAPELTSQYLNSFTIKQKINRDKKQARQLKIDATPMIVVDGKYIVETKGSYREMLSVVDYLVSIQKPNS